MGRYFECDICGQEAKGIWPCTCLTDLSRISLREIVGCKILDTFMRDNGYEMAYIMKLEKPDGTVVFARLQGRDEYYPATVSIDDDSSEYENEKLMEEEDQARPFITKLISETEILLSTDLENEVREYVKTAIASKGWKFDRTDDAGEHWILSSTEE